MQRAYKSVLGKNNIAGKNSIDGKDLPATKIAPGRHRIRQLSVF